MGRKYSRVSREAVFFLATNTLIVFGLVAFDNALAVLYTCRRRFPAIPTLPSPVLLVRALLTPSSKYDLYALRGMNDAVTRLSRKSRSFYLASSFFTGRLRIDLMLLYSYCRVADDLIDEATNTAEARDWIDQLREFLDLSYKFPDDRKRMVEFVTSQFPTSAQSALLLLPTKHLSKDALYDLLRGFEIDLQFSDSKSQSRFPVRTEQDLDQYGFFVAGTVAHVVLDLVFYHYDLPSHTPDLKRRVWEAGESMGIALQYTNIARDIAVDAKLGRVYIPAAWLEEESLTPEGVIENPNGAGVMKLRSRLLKRAFKLYEQARPAIEQLPEEVKPGMRVAVECYMEIARTLRGKESKVRDGAATVPVWRRITVAYRALSDDGSMGHERWGDEGGR